MKGEAKEKTKEENRSNNSKEKVNNFKQKNEIDDNKENKLNKVILTILLGISYFCSSNRE